MARANDILVGAKSHMLVVTGHTRREKKRFPNGAPAVVCRCDCGAETVVHNSLFRSGRAKSCGCLKRNVLGSLSRTHGASNSRVKGYQNRTYGIWQAMRDRCSNPNRKDWPHYGGKGISVCERWGAYENFVVDMGEAPPELTLHRVDNAKGYSPDNCIWATRLTQAQETVRTRYVAVDGIKRPAIVVARENGIPKGTYNQRLYVLGWPIERACGLSTHSVTA